MIVEIAGLTILVISAVGGLLLVNPNASVQLRQTKFLVFLLCFCMFAVVQLIIAAIAYRMASG